MYNDIKISVIVLADCTKEILYKCLTQLSVQTHELYECLIVIDKNGEISKQDVENFADGRMMPIVSDKSLISQKEMFNEGFGWLCSTSEYCICIDANDSFGCDYLNTMLNEIVDSDNDIVCGVSTVKQNDEIINGFFKDVVWNKIYKKNINWENAEVGFCISAIYTRNGLFEGKVYQKSELDTRLEDLKMAVMDPKYEYISFDIFDTLILRPFMNPQDLYIFLDEVFEKYVNCNKSFAAIRIAGESDLREKAVVAEEDITIDDIYDNIAKIYGIDKQILQEVKQSEKNLEIEFSQKRKMVWDIYQLALYSKKKIIFISDMYLDLETIKEILKKNDYNNYDNIFLSSQYKKLKGTGNLYKTVIDKLQVSPEMILHIGDDYFKDVEMAKKQGITAMHVPKTLDVFKNPEYCKGIETCISMTQKICGIYISYEKIEKSLGYRCMLAKCANKYFDNPFRPYNVKSILNQDPYFIGYYLMGMYMLGINQWIEEILTHTKYKKIYFTSRDGWMPMKAYNIMRKYKKELPPAEYFYTSREAVLPAMIKDKLDFYDLPIDIKRYTPNKLFQLLKFCTEKEIDEWENLCFKLNILPNKVFKTETEERILIKSFLQDFYNEEKHINKIKQIKKYYLNLNKDSLMFDMGYSGRIQKAICDLVGENIDVLFIHSDAEKHDILSRKGKYRIYNFFNYIPQMSDVMRESMLSAPTESCIGYQEVEGKIQPIFGKINRDNFYVIKSMQYGCEEFIQEYYTVFGEKLDYISFKSIEVSMPLEGFFRCNVEADREIFSGMMFDDVVYGGESKINFKGMIEQERAWLPNEIKIEVKI